MTVSQAFLCPITHNVMQDPVIDPDGNSYERNAIEQWLAQHGTSPITRAPLRVDDLRPNRALRDLIERAVDGENPSAQDAPIPDVVPDADIADLAARENAQVRVAIHTGDDGDFVVAVEPPLGRQRAAIDLCCVVDVSGSMCSSASIKVQGGSVEDMGLSILDVVKHALRTIIAALTPRDRLSIVAFHDTATVVLPLTPMNDTGKIEARQATASLEPLNSTNLWGGIRQGLDVLLPSDAHRAKALFVLTDGQPNVEPPRGHLPTLRLYLDRHPGRCVGDTFGFGYDLQSDLLRDIAVEMGGSYSFIPDAGMVGTVFIHALSNLLSSFAHDATLSVEGTDPEDTAFHGPGGKPVAWGKQLPLPHIPYGQSREFYFSKPPVDALSVALTYTAWHTPGGSVVRADVGLPAPTDASRAIVRAARARAKASELISKGSALAVESGRVPADALSAVRQEVLALAEEVKRSGDDALVALGTDLAGEVAMALEPRFFKTWGAHYLRSLLFAHSYQQCNNFKDPGVQVYGSELFRNVRDTLDDIYNKLPPPQPSRRTGSAPIASMAIFNSSSNPCFAGHCLAALEDGTLVRVDSIRRGDRLLGGSVVRCVVRTATPTGAALVRIGGMLVTEWHPVRVDGAWCFPAELGAAQWEEGCEAVYSFLLDGPVHEMLVGDVWGVTLGHGAVGDVREHAFLGTDRVREALAGMPGWEDGVMEVSGTVRDPDTGLVCGFAPAAPRREAERAEGGAPLPAEPCVCAC